MLQFAQKIFYTMQLFQQILNVFFLFNLYFTMQGNKNLFTTYSYIVSFHVMKAFIIYIIKWLFYLLPAVE